MQISYIFHSGFLVEFDDLYLLFDYYQKDLPKLNINKPILVLASHMHADHYNKDVFPMLENLGYKKENIKACLAKDIKSKNHPEGIDVLTANFNSYYEICFDTIKEPIKITTFHSTDSGVAYLVKYDSQTLFHAGDLNDWSFEDAEDKENRQVRGMYRAEINKLKEEHIDYAFLPLDPHQGSFYAEGIKYFIKTVDVSHIYPMHFWEQPEIINKLLTEYPNYTTKIMTSFTEVN